jgi:hypothetical protein
MNTMKKLIVMMLVLFLAGFSTVSAQFDNVGTSAASFLKIGVGSRGEAMGGAFVAAVNDPTALYWNVAGLASLEYKEILFSQNKWVLDINQSFLGVGLPLGDFGTLGFQISYLSMGEMKETTWDRPEGTGGTFTSYDAVIGVGYARRLTDKFSVGIQGKFITESISQSSASAWALDVGAIYSTGFSGLKIGVSIANFGTQMRMDGRDLRVKVDPYPTSGSNPKDVTANLETLPWSLPLYFQIGTSMEAVRIDQHVVTVNIDYRDERDYRPLVVYGMEYNFDNFLFLRGGLTDRYQESSQFYYHPSVTAGAGIRMLIPETDYFVKFDYAYSDLHRLQEAHRITVGLQF